MAKYIPDMYRKNIADINYAKLKELGIKCLIFDLDNTIALIDEKNISSSTKTLFDELKKEFTIVIISNNFKRRISQFCDPLDTQYVSFAMKPLTFGFKRVQEELALDKDEMCMIGDQLMTDILGGNNFGIFTILVDPLSKKDLKVTSINRRLENEKIKTLTKMNVLRRGNYYE